MYQYSEFLSSHKIAETILLAAARGVSDEYAANKHPREGVCKQNQTQEGYSYKACAAVFIVVCVRAQFLLTRAPSQQAVLRLALPEKNKGA